MNQKPATITLKTIAEAFECELRAQDDVTITGLGTLKEATSTEVAFLANPKYASQLADTSAAAVIVTPKAAASWDGTALISENPRLVFARLSHWFDTFQKPAAGIHPSANIDPTAEIADGVHVGAGAVIEAGVEVGANAIIGAGSFVGAGATLGQGIHLYPNVTVYHLVRIGDRTRVHSGCVIGADGFGFEKTNPMGEWVRVAQIGSVEIGKDCDIGACVTIDRGAIKDTVIGDNVILDNQIQVGHNCQIGTGTVMSGCTAIGGSTEIGMHCMVGGGSIFAGHLSVPHGTIITGGTAVASTIKERGFYSSGIPHAPTKEWKRNVARFRQLDKMAKRLSAVEKALDQD